MDTKEYIKNNEGYRSDIYDDTKNIPTIGYGFNMKADHVKKYIPKDVLLGKRSLKKDESDNIFTKVYTTAVNDAEAYVGSDVFNRLSNQSKKALIDVSYNIGGTKLRGFHRMREALISNDMPRARKELLDSDYAREDVPNRALKNANLFSPEDSSLMNLSSSNKISDFGKEFSKARKSGLKEFEYQGKKFKVEMK